MIKNMAWNFFLKTGDIDTYLCYKKIEDKIILEEDKLSIDEGKKMVTR